MVISATEIGVLCASELMSVLRAWIVPFSGSQIRGFRHTAIVLHTETASYQVITPVEKAIQATSHQKVVKLAVRSKSREQELDAKSKEIDARRPNTEEMPQNVLNAYA